MTKFKALEIRASKVSAVLERDRRDGCLYSVYSNTEFIESNCVDLHEVHEVISDLEAHCDINKFDACI